MKQLKIFIKKYLGEISLTGGVGLLVYSVFNFSYQIIGPSSMPRLPLRGVSVESFEPFQGIVYYYQPDTILMISIGAMLVVIGILIIKNK